MSLDGGLKPKNVWGNEGGKGNFSPESFADGDETEIDYLIESDGAANDPSLRDAASRGLTLNAIETDNSVLEKLLGEAELEIKNEVNLRPTFSADTDPTSPTGSQTKAVEEIYDDVRGNNLRRVTLPQGVPMQAGGEIDGDIRKTELVDNTPAWQKPAPVRDNKQAKPSFLKRFFG